EADVAGGFDLRASWARIPWPAKLVFVVGYIAFFFLAVRAIATTVHVASESHLGRKIGMRQAYGRVRRRNLGPLWFRFLPLLIFPLVTPVISFIVGPGIPVAVLENLNDGYKAVGRGWSLSKGSRGRVVLLFILGWTPF